MSEKNDELLRADRESRAAVTSQLNRNYFECAGAGSGKTSSTVSRMVELVKTGVDASAICAISFTVNAGRELSDRFQRELARCSQDMTLAEDARKHCQEALQNVDRAFLGTIDSFCYRVLKEHPTEAGVPSCLTQMDDPTAMQAYRREYARLKRGGYPDLHEKYRRFCKVQQQPDACFLGTIGKFMGAHAADWQIPELPPELRVTGMDPTEGWRDIYAPVILELCNVLDYLADHKADRFLRNGKNDDIEKAWIDLPSSRELLKHFMTAGIPDIIMALDTISAPAISKTGAGTGGLGLRTEPKDPDICGSNLIQRRGVRPPAWCLCLKDSGLLPNLCELRYICTVDFLSSFAKAMAAQLKANGELTYYDTLLYVRNMLREDAGRGGQLARHIRERYGHFLIDEFQDTDPMQAEIFFRICAEKQDPNINWRYAPLVPGSLFVVGDPKQSIYRFRGADVQTVMRVGDLFTGSDPTKGAKLSLTRNFRSCNALKEWYNAVFPNILQESDIQYPYELIPIEPEPETPETLCGVLSYPSCKDTQPMDVAKLISRLTKDPEILINVREGDHKVVRRVRYEDIMIITRSKTNMDQYAAVLQMYGIPCRVEGTSDFACCPAFQAMTVIFAALADPYDEAAVCRALCVAFGFSDRQLTAWHTGGHRFRLGANDGEADAISVALKQMDDFRRQHVAFPPAALCRTMVDTFQIFHRFGSQNMEYVWYAIELLQNGSVSGQTGSWKEAAKLLNALLDGSMRPERILDLDSNANRVHLANLHKVKGLQAPIVILAQTTAGNNAVETYTDNTTSTEAWKYVFILKPQGVSYAVAQTKQFAAQEEQEAELNSAEQKRLLYVAATRAECALLIPKRTDKGGIDPWKPLLTDGALLVKDGTSLLDEDWTERPAQTEAPGTAITTAYYPCQNTEPNELSWSLNTPSDCHDRDAEPAVISTPDPDAALPRSMKSSTLMGTAVHRAMELLVTSRAKLPDDIILDTVNEETGDRLAAEELDMLRTVLHTVRNGGWRQQTGVPADILNELLSADELYCEVPFAVSYRVDGCDHVVRGQMDAVYRKADAWHIVDYKTNADGDRLEQLYNDQMSAYRKAFTEILGEEADTLLYHIPLLAEE